MFMEVHRTVAAGTGRRVKRKRRRKRSPQEVRFPVFKESDASHSRGLPFGLSLESMVFCLRLCNLLNLNRDNC